MAGYSDGEFGIPGIPSGKTTGSPSKDAADQVKSGNTAALAYPNFFPGQGGLPIQLDDECNRDFTPIVEALYTPSCKIGMQPECSSGRN
jgi:hypothetical protein